MMEYFRKSFQLIMDIWRGPNTYELADVSYYKGGRLSLTRMFQCHKLFRKFKAKLIAFFEKMNGRQPNITCPASYTGFIRGSMFQNRKILQKS